MTRALINVPAKAKRGQIIEIKTLISHMMETGYRRDNVGKPIPHNIVTQLTYTYNNKKIFRADLYPAIAANPFLTFHTVQIFRLRPKWLSAHHRLNPAD